MPRRRIIRDEDDREYSPPYEPPFQPDEPPMRLRERVREEEPPVPAVEQDDLSALEGEGWVRVSRVSPEGDMMFLRKMERQVLSDDITFVAKTWGGGRYWLEVQNKFRQWQKKFYVTFDPKEYGPAKGTASIVKDGSVGPLVNDSGTDPLVASQVAASTQAIIDKDRQIAALNERMFTMQAQSHDRMMELMGKVLTQNKPEPMGMEKMVEMAQMLNSRPSGDGGLGEIVKSLAPVLVDGIRDMMKRRPAEAAVRGVAAAATSSPLERLAMPFIEAFIPVIARGITEQSNRVQPPLQRQIVYGPGNPASATGQPLPVQTATVPEPPAPAGNNGDGDGVPLVEKIKAHPMVKMVAPVLMSMARSSTPADEAAQNIADLVPERFWPIVVDLVNKPDLVAYLSVFEPDIAAYGGWLKAVADTLKRDFIEDEDGEEADEPADDVAEAATVAVAATAPSGEGTGEAQ